MSALTWKSNRERKFGAAMDYAHVRVKCYCCGKRIDLLLTDIEVQTAKVRALSNPEDVPPRWWWQRLAVFLKDCFRFDPE